MVDDARLLGVLVKLAGTVTTEYDLGEVLSEMLAEGCRALALAGGVVVLADQRGELYVAADSGAVVRRIAELEIEFGDGPSVRACGLGEPVTVSLSLVDDAGREFTGRAVGEGLQAVFSFPLYVGGHPVGALTLYREASGDLDVADRDAGQQLAAVAVAYVFHARERERFAQTTRALAETALTDPLTGLPNRRLFLDQLARVQAAARRNGTGEAVLFLDLDRFKSVNDSRGHEAGDRLLEQVAARLSGLVRPGDTVARFGGDEFAILCERLPAGHEAEDAAGVAGRVLNALSAPVDLPGGQLVLTTSIGIAVAERDDEPETLLRHADTAMYRAKQHGPGRFEIFNQEMHAQAVMKLETEAGLRVALDRGELVVHYQPIRDIRSRQLVAVEALLRWQHPERGLLAASEFLSVAEEAGLLIPIGTWVLNEACRQAARWAALQQPGREPVHVSVNLSPRQLSFPGLVDAVAKAVTDHDVAPRTICLEITEGLLVADAKASVSTLHALKAFGVCIALDNFGTGHSSLAYLQRFPIDQLKVDRSFIEELDQPQNRKIVQAVISLAHSLNLPVVGSGIETDQQFAVLRDLDCDWAQGHLLNRPGPPNAVDALLST
jgi:diguanylate cyclase (GGDEF)-like protein